MEMQVYIANLGKYNEDHLIAVWFSPPIDLEDVEERIGPNDTYEEYAIHDYEHPFSIWEYTSIDEINQLCEMVRELEGSSLYDELSAVQEMWFRSLEELLENKDDIICYDNCDSMEAVAQYYVEETGGLGEIPSNLQNHIDYQALGHDTEIEGNFLVTSHGVFEYIG